MSYQVLARKWRPQRFDDVVGQAGVTGTLKNAVGSGRLAQAFVFAGPRGVGKTTTARLLARALNCQNGPTADPCGTCEACREIAVGRDMDVLEIDAATHTGIDNVRDVIISGLAVPPARDRYKVFIIDEVHQLSKPSFAALLKSIEEPPPHVVFVMATTELAKIPETIISRAQVYEFRTISEKAIAAQLRKIADAERFEVSAGALALIARAADGSMRDGLTAFDQVLAFAGEKVSEADVASALGIVGRDLLLDILDAVAAERASAAFDLANRAIETGYELRLLCRDLSRIVRDLMLISVDEAYLKDPEVVPEGERDRVGALVKQFSREDLLRSFDLISRAEFDLRNAAEPRYHLEMALLKWIHLRKLTPLSELIEQLRSSGALPPVGRAPSSSGGGGVGAGPRRAFPPAAPAKPSPAPGRQAPAAPRPTPVPPRKPALAPPPADEVFEADGEEGIDDVPEAAPSRVHSSRAEAPAPRASAPAATASGIEASFVEEVRRTKDSFVKMYLSLAERVDVESGRIVFVFSPARRAAKDAVEKARAWLEPIAARVAGRRMLVTATLEEPSQPAAGPGAGDGADSSSSGSLPLSDELKAKAMSDPGMQTLLELMPLDIKSVEPL
jgi:DNA polymerase-3 subunit gamma/tau